MQAQSKKIIFIAVLLTGCIITSLISTNDKAKALPGGSSLLQSAQGAVTSKAAQTKTVRVQVSGAVLEPGIYDVPASCRVEEAIAAAGGLTENADSERVNLVRKVRDGMQIRVPVQKAGTSRTQRKSAQAKSGLGESASKKYGSAKAGSGRNSSMMQSVRINSASAGELQQLPGIGPALAQRIVETRNSGRFTSADDLLRVPGIGKAKLAKLRDYVEVD